MKETVKFILAALSVVAANIVNSLGGWDRLALALVVAMVIDYATGLACAAIWHRSPKSAGGTLESRAGLKGLFRKGAIILCCLLAAQFAAIMNTPAVRDSAIIFFICNETLSIVENLGIMGVPFPPAISRAIEALHKDDMKPPDTPVTIDADYTEYSGKH